MEARFSIREFREWLEFRRHGWFTAASPFHSREVLDHLVAALPARLEPLLWMATSGTTSSGVGFPSRWVGHTRESLMASAKAVCTLLEVRPSDRWGRALPLHHMGGLSIEVRASYRRFQVEEWKGDWNPIDFPRWLAQSKVTIISLVPAQIHDLVRLKSECPPCVRAVVVGADRLPGETLEGALELRWPILPSYGMTETASMIACHLPGSNVTKPEIPLIEGVRAWVDERGSLEGRLRIDCPQLFHSELLWKDTRYELRRRPRGPWQTEDRVRLSPDLKSVTPLGRDPDFVKILGEGVYLSDLDARLAALLKAAGYDGDCAFQAVADERAGSRLVIVLTRDFPAALELWNSRCAPFERTEATRTVAEMPRTELGKLKRSGL